MGVSTLSVGSDYILHYGECYRRIRNTQIGQGDSKLPGGQEQDESMEISMMEHPGHIIRWGLTQLHCAITITKVSVLGNLTLY